MTLRKTATLFAWLLAGSAVSTLPGHTQAFGGAEAAKAQQALDASYPKLQYTEEVLPLRIPGHTLGETEGVSKNAAGHLFVYSRTGKGGQARGGTAAELYEFDQNYKFVKEWFPDSYGASFAHSVRIDKDQNVWIVDEGSSMVIEARPNGDLVKEFGRKPEAIDYLETYLERGEKIENRFPVGGMGTFNRPTDIAWDQQGNSYVSDGYGNSRVVKIAKDGTWLKAVGTHGSGDGQFMTPHGIAVDQANNLVIVADRNNNRIQVYDYDLNFKKYIKGIGAPWSVQVTPKYIYSGDGGSGKIYRIDKQSGNILGVVQTGLGQGQTSCLIHELYAESDTVVYRGACSEWNIEKITFKN
jgi:DNA-binding beta-propeller fold protein YncE